MYNICYILYIMKVNISGKRRKEKRGKRKEEKGG
jgi:hypothetical protein